MELIHNWSEEDREQYSKKVMIVEHWLEKTGLFTDEKLIEMLDNHPNHLIDFQHIPDDPDYPDQQVTVDFSGADGQTMLEAAQSDAKIWINAREVMNRQPAYREALDQIHFEMEALTGKNKDRRNCRGGILISSKSASTPYHADPTITHLWHVRGHKKVWVYPCSQKFMPDEAYEAIILGEVDEDMPFDPTWDKEAIVGPVDLHGGEFVSWPHRSPHRVKNVSFCVSMVIEFSTHESAFVNSVMFTNGIMRRQFGRRPEYVAAAKVRNAAKASLGFSLRKLGVRQNFRRKDMVQYVLDKTVNGYVRAVKTPYVRTH